MNMTKRDTPRKVQSVVRTRSRWRDRGAPVPVPIMFALMAITSETARRITRSSAQVRRTALTLALLLLAPLAFAQTKWELLVAGADSPCGPLSPPPSPAAEFIGLERMKIPTIYGAAAAPNGVVYGVSDHVVKRIDVRTMMLADIVEAAGTRQILTITVDRDGNVYALAEPTTGGTVLLKFNGGGKQLAAYPYDLESDYFSMDLAADQCTLFISDGARIRRFDGCRGVALPDFEFDHGDDPLTDHIGSVRVLPDGGLLAGIGAELYRIDANGVVVRVWRDLFTSPFGWPYIGALGLANGGKTAWVGGEFCARELLQIDLESGAVTARVATGIEMVGSVVAYDMWTAAIGGPEQPFAYEAAVISTDEQGSWLELVGADERKSIFITPRNAEIAAAPDGIRITADPGNDEYYLETLRTDGRREVLKGAGEGGGPRAIVADRSGWAYVLREQLFLGGTRLMSISPDGQQAVFEHGHGVWGPLGDATDFDLASDQCTLWAIEHDSVRRYDACANVYRADFATGLAGAKEIRILPHGVLVSVNDRLIRYDANGSVVRTYTPGHGPIHGLTLSDGGGHAWFTARDVLYELDLASGLVLRSTLLRGTGGSIVPRDVWTAALSAGTPPRRRAVGR